jgi:hypothetical protein
MTPLCAAIALYIVPLQSSTHGVPPLPTLQFHIGRVVGLEMARWRFTRKMFVVTGQVTGLRSTVHAELRTALHRVVWHNTDDGTDRRNIRIGASGPHPTLPSIFPHHPHPSGIPFNLKSNPALRALMTLPSSSCPVQYETVGDRKRTMRSRRLETHYQMRLQ